MAGLLLVAALAACGPLAPSRPSGPPTPVSNSTPASAATGPSVPQGPRVGERAPDFSLTTLDGRPLTSAELLAQGKPFILYFFATW